MTGKEQENEPRSEIRPVPVKILHRFFPVVDSFPQYLKSIIAKDKFHLVDQLFHAQDQVGQRELDLLRNSWIGTREKPDNVIPIEYPWMVQTEQDAPRAAAISSSIAQLMEDAKCYHILSNTHTKGASNLLTIGYREANERLSGLLNFHWSSSLALTNFHVNPYPSQILLSCAWSRLTELLGIPVLSHLLKSVALFVPVTTTHGNLIQVLGPHLGDMFEDVKTGEIEPRRNHAGSEHKRKRRRKRSKRSAKNAQDQISTTATIENRGRLGTFDLRTASVPNRPLSLQGAPLAKAFSAPTAKNARPQKPKVVIAKQKLHRKVAEIVMPRQKIFYSSPQKARSGAIAIGLPVSHVFNRYEPKRPLKGNRDLPDKAKILGKFSPAHARYILQHVFPCEYGLRSPFQVRTNKKRDVRDRQDFANRKDEIQRLGCTRTPKRLQKALRLIKIMLLKHKRMDYRKLLQYTCPSTLPRRHLTHNERQQIQDSLAEEQPPLQPSQTLLFTQPQSASLQQPARNSPSNFAESSKLTFTKYKAPHGSVSRFAQCVLRTLIPMELFGSYSNMRLIMRNVDQFVRMRRFETTNLHRVCQKICILDFAWLLPRKERALWQRPTRAEMDKRQSLLHQFMFFIFDSILIPLLRNNFYVTESSRYRNRVLYFRHDDWNAISQPVLGKLKDGCFEKIGKHKAVGIMSQRSFGYSFVRLLPKETGMRPIVNLRRRSVKVEREASVKTPHAPAGANQRQKDDAYWGHAIRPKNSINVILGAVFQVLNYEKTSNAENTGCSVFSPQDIYTRLVNFKKELEIRQGATNQQLYFVKVDITGAFDCIDQDKLMTIMEDVLKHDRYIIQKFLQLVYKNGHPFKKWCKEARPEINHEPFDNLVEELARNSNLRNAILCDSVIHPDCERESLRWLLHEHICQNLVKIGKDFCLQSTGIPQGSTLSTLLCCFYLARMEKDLNLDSLNHTSSSLMMRYTDDYLFISSDREQAQKFYNAIQRGCAKFNCQISPEKTQANFMLDLNAGQNAAAAGQITSRGLCVGPKFPWCSYLIDTSSLNVQYDLQQYHNVCFSDSITIPHHHAHTNLLGRVVTNTVHRRNLLIYLDVNLNGMETVVINIHQSFILATFKLLAAFRSLQKTSTSNVIPSSQQATFLHKCIKTSIEHCYAHARSKMARSMKQAEKHSDAAWPITKMLYQWIAFHATMKVFSYNRWTRNLHTRWLVLQDYKRLISKLKSNPMKQGEICNFTFEEIRGITNKAWNNTLPILHSTTFT